MDAFAFDVDGVLIDSVAVQRRVWPAWARRHGLDVERVWLATFGQRLEDTIAQVAPDMDPAVERPELERMFAAEEDGLRAMKGARALLDGLDGMPWAVVTSQSARDTVARFRRLGLPLPRVRVFGEDVARGKPDPECYRLACRDLGVQPDRCTVLEDAPAGIASARAAGCRVIAVATTHAAADLLEADLVCADLEEVARRLLRA
jgi:mannitol-1-/sugar-/sorbitol-6-phosphatase